MSVPKVVQAGDCRNFETCIAPKLSPPPRLSLSTTPNLVNAKIQTARRNLPAQRIAEKFHQETNETICISNFGEDLCVFEEKASF
jgi:hypothetical protein